MHNKHKSFTAKWGKETGGGGVWEEQQEGKEIAKAQKSDAKNVEVEKKQKNKRAKKKETTGEEEKK